MSATIRRRGAGDGPWVAVAGARPNYVKLAPLVRAAAEAGRELAWLDSGQHTDPALSAAMCADLGLPRPRVRLVARRGPGRVGRMAAGLGAWLEAARPALVVVLGDVDTTLAAALAAWGLDLPLAHVEAGLRSLEPRMPEERNRVIVDALSDRLYLPEGAARAHVAEEGIGAGRVRVPGNVMADALRQQAGAIEAAAARAVRGLGAGPHAVATLHRQANVDDPRRLAACVAALLRVARDLPVVWPVHPRTRRRLQALGGTRDLARRGVRLGPPRPYLAFLGLVARAAVVLTDSGGLQVEAALLGVPCVTARRRTEHTLTVAAGANRLAGDDPRRWPRAVAAALEAGPATGARPRAWDGRASGRIVADWLAGFPRPRRLPGPSPARRRALERL